MKGVKGYEAEKKRISQMGLSPDKYQKAMQKISRKYKI